MAKTKIETTEAEINVDHDELISELGNRMAEEYARGSDASESGAATKAYLEKTNLNSQAFSWAKAILKKLPKKDGQTKAMDVIRSLNVLLPMIENHVVGQGTAEMDLGEGEEVGDLDEAAEIEDDNEEFEDALSDLDDDISEDGDGEFEDGSEDEDNVVPMPEAATAAE